MVDALFDIRPLQASFYFPAPHSPAVKEKQGIMMSYIQAKFGSSIPFEIIQWPENLGASNNIIRSLDHFFSRNKFGIIIEDDCVPSPQFFQYISFASSQRLLDDRIVCITGNRFSSSNLFFGKKAHLSKFYSGWGWATWSDVWDSFRAYTKIDSPEIVRQLFLLLKPWERKYFKQVLDSRELDSVLPWDYAFQFMMITNKWKCLVPPYNLVQNIGFTKDATHTFNLSPDFFSVPLETIPFESFSLKVSQSRIKMWAFEVLHFFRNHLNVLSFRDLMYVLRENYF